MRELFILVVCYILPVIRAVFEIYNEDLGDFHFRAKSGVLPPKYYPMSELDHRVSDKVADIIDFIQLVPKIDPLKKASLEPLGFDVPFLWLEGEVSLKNFVLAGVKSLQLRGVEMRMNNLRADLNISIPLIYFEGDFMVQASVSEYIPMMFSCHISAKLMDFDITVASGIKVIAAPPTGEVLQVDSATVLVDIRNVQMNLTNVAIGGAEEDLRFAATELFTGYSNGNIFDNLLTSALRRINQELVNVSSEVFRSYLLD